jgi:hypothetical protein
MPPIRRQHDAGNGRCRRSSCLECRRDRGDAQPLVDTEPGAPAAVDGDAAVCVLGPADAVSPVGVVLVCVDAGVVCVAAALSVAAGPAVADVVLVEAGVAGVAVLVGVWVVLGVVAAPLVAVDVPAAADALVGVAAVVAGAAAVAVGALAEAGAGALSAAGVVVAADSDVPAVEPPAADAVDPLCAVATGEGAAACAPDDESPPTLIPVAGPLAAWLPAAVVSLGPPPTAAVGAAWIDEAAVDGPSADDAADVDDAGCALAGADEAAGEDPLVGAGAAAGAEELAGAGALADASTGAGELAEASADAGALAWPLVPVAADDEAASDAVLAWVVGDADTPPDEPACARVDVCAREVRATDRVRLRLTFTAWVTSLAALTDDAPHARPVGCWLSRPLMTASIFEPAPIPPGG